MTGRRLAVVSAGLGTPSSTPLLAARLARATEQAIHAAGEEVDIEVVELRGLATELAHHLAGLTGPGLAAAQETVSGADGLIVVSPIFNASYSGLFKMFFDALEPGTIEGKPVLMAATAGTARHSLALEHSMRPLFTYLKAVVVPTAVFAASEDWGSAGTSEGDLAKRVENAGSQLARSMLAVPHIEGPRHLEVTPFADLLGSVGGGDVDHVGVVDEVGPGLPMQGQPSEERDDTSPESGAVIGATLDGSE